MIPLYKTDSGQQYSQIICSQLLSWGVAASQSGWDQYFFFLLLLLIHFCLGLFESLTYCPLCQCSVGGQMVFSFPAKCLDKLGKSFFQSAICPGPEKAKHPQTMMALHSISQLGWGFDVAVLCIFSLDSSSLHHGVLIWIPFSNVLPNVYWQTKCNHLPEFSLSLHLTHLFISLSILHCGLAAIDQQSRTFSICRQSVFLWTLEHQGFQRYFCNPFPASCKLTLLDHGSSESSFMWAWFTSGNSSWEEQIQHLQFPRANWTPDWLAPGSN